MQNCLSAGMARHWQFDQVRGVWFDSAPNQKRLRFHLCLLHFLFLTSSRRNWNWQGNYHFILNWSQAMWAGSKRRDTRGGKRETEEKKNTFWEHLAMVQSSARRIAWRVGKDGERERSREGEKKGRGDFWRLRCGCSLDVPLTGTRLGAARRRRFGFFIRLAPPGFSWPEQAGFGDAVARSWSQPVV